MLCPKCQTNNPDDSKFCKECATSLTGVGEARASFTKTIQVPSEQFPRGATFADRYEIIELLGQGGMGTVYRVEDTKVHEEVALKQIRPEISSDNKTIERFSNELKITRKIAHRNVCKMYDLGEAEGIHFITMEYVPGQDLKGLIKQTGKLAVSTALVLAEQVCEGLSEAHRLGVIHRDLKPSNIMIDKEGDARIMDFGIARSLHTKGITGEGVIIGTPEYMSPEQVEGKETDQRSDIYSLGVILYEMVTGRVPFDGDTPYTIGVKHKSEIPRDPKQINAQISDDLNQAILRCLEKEPALRFQSVEELLLDLRTVKESITSTDRFALPKRPLTSKDITAQFKKKKILFPLFVILVALCAIFVIQKVLPGKKETLSTSSKPSIAVLYFLNDTGDSALDNLKKVFCQYLTQDLSQSQLVNVLSMDKLYSIAQRIDVLDAQSYSSEDLKRVAEEGDVDFVVQPSFSKLGDTFRIDYSLHEAENVSVIASGYIEGDQAAPTPDLIDELTRRVKTDLGLTAQQIENDIDQSIADVTTSNPQALELYIEGERKHYNGNQSQAIADFEKAIKIDPDFAMAYLMLSTIYANREQWGKRNQYLEKAFSYKDRLPDREKHILQGSVYCLTENTLPKAIDEFNKVLEKYPDDFLANMRIGWAYGLIGDFDLSRRHFSKLVSNNTKQSMVYSNLAHNYATNSGEYSKAREVFQSYLDNISENTFYRLYISGCYAVEHRFDLAQIELDKAIESAPENMLMKTYRGHLQYLQDNLGESERLFQENLDGQLRSARVSLWWMRCLYLVQGKLERAFEQYETIAREIPEGWSLGDRIDIFTEWGLRNLKLDRPKQALEKFNKASEQIEHLGDEVGRKDVWMYLRPKRGNLYWQALAYIKMNDLETAYKMMREINSTKPDYMKKGELGEFPFLDGHVAMMRNDVAEAILCFEKTAAELQPECYIHWNLNHAFFLDDLAKAYYRNGDSDNAILTYERITQLTSGRFQWGEIYARSYYMLGKLYEEKDWKGKATENYEKFLILWKDADQGLMEVDDARSRLARMENN